MNNITYVGPFKKTLKNYIEIKQAMGYKYYAEAANLGRFDIFTSTKYPDAKILTKEIVLDWCAKKTYEAQANKSSRASILREFAKYINSLGVSAYILPKGYYPAPKQYIPYIYSTDELARFFAQTNQCQYCCECPNRHLIMPVIFRMIYMCGLRVSEARLLKVGDVDLVKGVLSINHSKKDNSRLVCMSDDLMARCQRFSETAHLHSSEEDYYFPALGGKPMTIVNLYKNFRRFLWRAGISHKGNGYGPRINDLRHTYAVYCLKN